MESVPSKCQLYSWWIMLAFLVRSCTPESISRKNHVTRFMTLSIDVIYQELSSVQVSTGTMSWNLYIVCINKQLRSCACADVLDFKYRDVKMFLLKLWSELQSLVKIFQSAMKIQTKYRPNFHEVENFHEVKCTVVGEFGKSFLKITLN